MTLGKLGYNLTAGGKMLQNVKLVRLGGILKPSLIVKDLLRDYGVSLEILFVVK
jgi:hypothetical protein